VAAADAAGARSSPATNIHNGDTVRNSDTKAAVHNSDTKVDVHSKGSRRGRGKSIARSVVEVEGRWRAATRTAEER
jgi:hypothetical protein